MSGRSLIINSQSVAAEAIPVIIKNIEGVVVNVGASVEISNDIGNPLPVTAGQISTLTATIANAASVSANIDLGTARLGRIAMPAAWTAADITLQTSNDNVTWNDLYDKDGVEYAIKAAAARAVLIPLSDMLSVRYLRIRSGTAALPVAQAGARTLVLVLVP